MRAMPRRMASPAIRARDTCSRRPRATRDAERGEVRHARATARLARRFGGRYVRPTVEAVGERTLEAIALENAVEGCVGESFGALVATWQSENATDAAVRDAFQAIAADE